MTKYAVSWIDKSFRAAGEFMIADFDAASDLEAGNYCHSRGIEMGCLVRPDGNIVQMLETNEEAAVRNYPQGIPNRYGRIASPVAPIEVLAQTAIMRKQCEPFAAKITDVVEGLRGMYAPYVEMGKAPVELFQKLIDSAERMQLVRKEGDRLYYR